jgi:hypothetical protein
LFGFCFWAPCAKDHLCVHQFQLLTFALLVLVVLSIESADVETSLMSKEDEVRSLRTILRGFVFGMAVGEAKILLRVAGLPARGRDFPLDSNHR